MELTVQGKRVFAATGGQPIRPELPTAIFLHGSGMDRTVWTLQTRYFAHHGRNVMAVDLPGHGRSEGPALASVGAMADWLIQAMDAAGLEQAALVGHSMGALVALEAASRAPQRVWALALLGVAHRMPVHPDLIAAAEHDEPAAQALVASWGFGRRAHLGGAQAPGLWMLGGGLRLLGHAREGVLATDLKACDAYDGAEAAAARVTCPALLLVGSADRMTPPAQARPLAQKLTEQRTVKLAGAGHMMMIEQPDATIAALGGTI